MGLAYMFINGSMILLFISICQHHDAFYKMIQYSVRKLNDSNDDKSNEEIVRDLIDLNIQVKE